MKNILISGHTHPGMRRKENEDTYICRELWNADSALLVVIDGVGGYAGGEKAASLAAESIDHYMQFPKGDTLTMLREAVIFANNQVVEERKNDPRFADMCCVLTAAVTDLSTGSVHYVHIGDTRLYRFRKGKLKKLTSDHSYVGLQEDAGTLSEEEAMHHPQRNVILREVGSAVHRIDDVDFMDYGSTDFLPGDNLLLCSDGLTDMVTAEQIVTVLLSGQSQDKKANALISLANALGGYDNITVVLARNNLRHEKHPPKVTQLKQQVEMDQAGEVSEELKESGQKNSAILLSTIIVLVLMLAGWYLLTNGHTQSAAVLPEPVKDSVKVQPVSILGSQPVTPSAPRPAVVVDTIRLSKTESLKKLQGYADSVNKRLLLIPANEKSSRFAAVEINSQAAKPGDTILIRNIFFRGFETGIKTNIPIAIKLDNVGFENIKFPFNFSGRTDSSHSSVMIIQTTTQ
jgi:serine/threonine protein phosphatase PrpC